MIKIVVSCRSNTPCSLENMPQGFPDCGSWMWSSGGCVVYFSFMRLIFFNETQNSAAQWHNEATSSLLHEFHTRQSQWTKSRDGVHLHHQTICSVRSCLNLDSDRRTVTKRRACKYDKLRQISFVKQSNKVLEYVKQSNIVSEYVKVK